MTPESIYNALTLGRMVLQATALSDDERKAVSVYSQDGPSRHRRLPVVLNRCTSSPPMRDPSSAGGWNGWGNGVANTRFQSAANGGLTAADLPKLKLKWAFGYSVVTSARAQPIVAGGRLFVASENMEIHALDPKTGCTHWTYKAQAGVRTALSAGLTKARANPATRSTSVIRARMSTRWMRTAARSCGSARLMTIDPRRLPAPPLCTAARSSSACRG